MTLGEFLFSINTFADQQSLALSGGAVLVPLAGTLAARIGKGGKTDRDGRAIASVTVGITVIVALAAALFVAAYCLLLGRALTEVSAAILLAPIASVAIGLVAIRLVFPLAQLGSWQTLTDVVAFLATSGAVLWVCSKFWGWGVFFVGSAFQLLIIAVLAALVVRRMFRRAFGLSRSKARSET